MKRILSSLNRRSNSELNGGGSHAGDSPESVVRKEVAAFCEAGRGPSHQGNEYVHLPAIVENAASSPTAAKEAAACIRKFLANTSSARAPLQYNAIMLVRILVDNPGHTFTRNLDAKFVNTVKDLLRQSKDRSIQHFLRETLDTLEMQRPGDRDLAQLLQMWRKEKVKYGPQSPQRPPLQAQTSGANYQPPMRQQLGLPPVGELATRIAEAKNTAKLLQQFVQSTPPAELQSNELIREFADRCRTASRSMQSYIDCTNPPPDEDTLATLIETNDQLSVAQSQYHRATLNARRTYGSPSPPQQPNGSRAQSPLSSSISGALTPTLSSASRERPVPPVPVGTTTTTATTALPAAGSSPTPAPTSGSTLIEFDGEGAPVGATAPSTTLPSPSAPPPSRTPQSFVSVPVPVSGGLGGPSLSARTPSPAETGTGPGTATPRYEYKSEDFHVQNPFADEYATGDAETRERGGEASTSHEAKQT